MNEKRYNQEFKSDQEQIKQSFKKLQKIAEVLGEMGFKVIDNVVNIDILIENRPFSLVRDGIDGIRATYEKGRLLVWFTNKFEDPDNPRRQEVVARLKQEGLWENR